MMEKKKKLTWIWILVISLLGLSCFTAGLYRVVKLVNDNKRAQNSPPTVQITSPEAGQTVPANSSLFVSASALGRSPIMKMELWLDGQLVEQTVNSTAGSGSFSGQFTVSLTDGGHMFFVRAIDLDGLIGQSLPIPVYGSSEMADAANSVYPAQEGDTLAGIADDLDLDQDALSALNPGLGAGGLAVGTQVTLPIEGEVEPQPKQPPASVVQPAPIHVTDSGMLPAIMPPSYIAAARDALMQRNLPAAPSDLRALVQAAECKMTLSWIDNADKEDYYRIWIAGLGIPPRVIATVSSSAFTGPVWYQFDIPPAGIYSFWVEAVNGLGAQPSEIEWVGIPATQCEQYTAAYLELEITKIRSLGGQYDRYYCYLSVEGAPERRFPADDSQFMITGWVPGDITMYLYGNNIISIPIPEDNELNLEGECMAWAGDNLLPVGKFSKSVPSTSWDGSEQVIDEPGFKISFTVKPFGAMEARGAYTFYDPTIQAPFNLQEIDTGIRGNPFHPTDRILTWDWKGDESTINGFTVFLNDQPFKAALPNERQVRYSPPVVCGTHLKFEVAVNVANGQSKRSAAFEYDLKPCRVLAEVHFVSFTTQWTDDGCVGPDCLYDPCDDLEAYYRIWASGANLVEKDFWGGNIFLHVSCDTYYPFSQLGDTDKIIVPIDPNDPCLQFGVHIIEDDGVMPDDDIVKIKDGLCMPIDDWPKYEKEFTYGQINKTSPTTTIIRVRGFRDVGQ